MLVVLLGVKPSTGQLGSLVAAWLAPPSGRRANESEYREESAFAIVVSVAPSDAQLELYEVCSSPLATRTHSLANKQYHVPAALTTICMHELQ